MIRTDVVDVKKVNGSTDIEQQLRFHHTIVEAGARYIALKKGWKIESSSHALKQIEAVKRALS